MPTRLIPLTDIARQAVCTAEVIIEQLPFRVGRERRNTVATGVREERRTGMRPTNDLYIVDNADFVNVSRAHFMIESRDGKFLLTDVGSQCGTIVEGTVIGGGRMGGSVELHDQDVIIVGTAGSPFIFRFRV